MFFRYLGNLFAIFYLLLVFSAHAQKPLPDVPLAEEPEVLGGLTVEVKGLVGGFESIPNYSAILLFKNGGGEVCWVSRYMLRWDGGWKEVEVGEAFEVGAGGEVERRVNIADLGLFGISRGDAEARISTLKVDAVCD